MVVAGDVGYPLELARERQCTEHDDGLHDVFVDLEAFFVSQRATADRQVVQLAVVAGVAWQVHVEPPDITRVVLDHRRRAGAPGHAVLGAVGQQWLLCR
ncbi:hypothetical protein D3C75_1120980 [compost metagenome]